jgi:hypothetical protein
MANFKVDITKRLGVFHAAFYDAAPGGAAPALEKQPPMKSMEDVLKLVRESYSKSIGEEDSVIFRGIAYSSLGELEQQIKRAPY